MVGSTRLSTSLLALLSCTSPTVAFVQPSYGTRPTTALREASPPFSTGGPSQELLDLFSNQVSHELSASQFYLSASIWFENRDWEGMASYMLAESSEERGHALQLIDFANKRNIPVKLQGLDAPNADWESPEEVWRDVLKLEQGNTESLLHLAEAASKCQDYAVLACLNPFHMEQVDSESKISTIIAKVSDENRTPGLLRQLDHELGMEAGQA
ncbi:hypothetical protein ACHAXR_003218 [Thalassiosira sp. AJA248-18]